MAMKVTVSFDSDVTTEDDARILVARIAEQFNGYPVTVTEYHHVDAITFVSATPDTSEVATALVAE